MLLALPLLAGLLVGLVTGGSFRGLAAVQLRTAWLFLLGLGIQVVLYNPWVEPQSWDIRYSHGFYLVSLLLLFAGLLVNLGRVRWPLMVLAAGAALNLIVIVANGAAMPVDAHLLALARGQHLVWLIAHNHLASNVFPATGHVRLGFLEDRIGLASSVYSIGDVLIGLGGFLVAAIEMHRTPHALPERQTRGSRRRSARGLLPMWFNADPDPQL